MVRLKTAPAAGYWQVQHAHQLPPIDSELVQVHRSGSARPQAIDLKIGEQDGAPPQSKCRRDGGIDGLLCSVKPHGLVGHFAISVARKLNLNVMPGVRRPLAWVAACF